jgi:gamma-glutamyl-gamma-aminobutyrate hydrolase PuuD
MPHSFDAEYAKRAIPQYERAVELAGGEAVRVGLDQSPNEIRKVMERCDGVLLPGSKADVDPAKFNAVRSAHTAVADPRRDAVDELLLQDAYRLRKPVLGICYGLQTLNVYRAGSLIQHIPDFLPEETRAKANHEAGRKVAIAHAVEIEAGSRLAEIVGGSRGETDTSGAKAQGDNSERNRSAESTAPPKSAVPPKSTVPPKIGVLPQIGVFQQAAEGGSDGASVVEALEAPRDPKSLGLGVNSSHHQSAEMIGDGLRIVARCPDDGIVEALEGTAPDHFVLAVQWHPERSVEEDAASRAIFRAFIEAAGQRLEKLAGDAIS